MRIYNHKLTLLLQALTTQLVQSHYYIKRYTKDAYKKRARCTTVIMMRGERTVRKRKCLNGIPSYSSPNHFSKRVYLSNFSFTVLFINSHSTKIFLPLQKHTGDQVREQESNVQSVPYIFLLQTTSFQFDHFQNNITS